jgi:hypothetical protein
MIAKPRVPSKKPHIGRQLGYWFVAIRRGELTMWRHGEDLKALWKNFLG